MALKQDYTVTFQKNPMPQQQKPVQQEQQQKRDDKKKPNKIQSLRAFYVARSAWRFYTAIAEDIILSAVIASPVWAYFHYSGIKSVTISTDFLPLMVIAFFTFTLQNSMFKGH